jgi:hypothetical protein
MNDLSRRVTQMSGSPGWQERGEGRWGEGEGERGRVDGGDVEEDEKCAERRRRETRDGSVRSDPTWSLWSGDAWLSRGARRLAYHPRCRPGSWGSQQMGGIQQGEFNFNTSSLRRLDRLRGVRREHTQPILDSPEGVYCNCRVWRTRPVAAMCETATAVPCPGAS